MDDPHSRPRSRPHPHPPRAMLGAALCAALLVALAATAQAQSCSSPGFNVQCTEFGTIAMDSQRDIRGDPIDLTVSFTLNTLYAEEGTRWLLVTVRNDEAGLGDPVTIDLVRFAGVDGAIFTARIDQPAPDQLDIWVDALDVPVGTPLQLDLRVGATERGAFQLEALVMVFDRGYAPMRDAAGNDASLFSSTLLGVNKETKDLGTAGGSLVRGTKIPGLEATAALGALIAVALVLRRRAA